VFATSVSDENVKIAVGSPTLSVSPAIEVSPPTFALHNHMRLTDTQSNIIELIGDFRTPALVILPGEPS
jgi:hypothetical protein